MDFESQMVVIFGATGDLAKRKLLPALYQLLEAEKLASNTQIICLGRSTLTHEQFIEHLRFDTFIADGAPETLVSLAKAVSYHRFDPGVDTPEKLQNILRSVRQRSGCEPNMLFYLALPTLMFARVARLIEPLLGGEGWKRVIFEKPFGENLTSAEKLNEDISSVLGEEQIYRVDHYLGKELVQNILFLRFANEIFTCAWNRDAIDHVQITVSESLGVEERAGYYDKSGAIRDMVQNHLLQLLSFVAMEPPLSGHGNAIRDEAARVIENVRLPQACDVVVGQYGAGKDADKSLRAYLQEDDIPLTSRTETYAAVRVYVDTPRWQGVPFYLRTGKRLSKRCADIKVVFRQHQLKGLIRQNEPNMITIRIQPDEGIALAFNVRKPGVTGKSESVLMDFCHHCHFGPNTPEAYEAIMASVMGGDPLLFTRWDWLKASWRFIDCLRTVAPPVVLYQAGSSGPREADHLLEVDNRFWY